MDKKDIYEHLAEIYLNASSKKKKVKAYLSVFKNSLLISGVIISLFIILLFILPARDTFLFTNSNQNKPIGHQFALVLQPDIVKINFDFDSMREEIYSINLNKLNLSRFKTLTFSVRKAHYENKVALRLELTNTVGERASLQIDDIPSYKWQGYRINLVEFKNISDWSEILNLSFIVRESNPDNKSGIVYIDNVRLLR